MKSENNPPQPQHQPGVSRSYHHSDISHHTLGRATDYREHLAETWRDKIAEIIWKRTELLSLAHKTAHAVRDLSGLASPRARAFLICNRLMFEPCLGLILSVKTLAYHYSSL